MNKLVTLQTKAIKAAKSQDWNLAAELNQEIISHKPADIGAHNRLGIAYLQLNKKTKAKEAFSAALKIDKSNQIALKHLDKLKKNQAVHVPTFQRQQFIEEPGKTKTTTLHRLAGKEVLEDLSVGQEAELVIKSRYISVNVGSNYVGALPEDLSFRLSKLIKSGNTYQTWIRSVSENSCTIFIKEVSRSKDNHYVNSFPTSKSSASVIADIDESLLVEEKIPVEFVDTDQDDDSDTPEDVHTTTAR